MSLVPGGSAGEGNSAPERVRKCGATGKVQLGVEEELGGSFHRYECARQAVRCTVSTAGARAGEPALRGGDTLLTISSCNCPSQEHSRGLSSLGLGSKGRHLKLLFLMNP